MHSVGDVLQKVEKTLHDSNMRPRPGPGPRCQLRAQGPMGPWAQWAHGPTIWICVKDGKTKLWENEATHLRINKKAWICVKHTFVCITWGLGGSRGLGKYSL